MSAHATSSRAVRDAMRVRWLLVATFSLALHALLYLLVTPYRPAPAPPTDFAVLTLMEAPGEAEEDRGDQGQNLLGLGGDEGEAAISEQESTRDRAPATATLTPPPPAREATRDEPVSPSETSVAEEAAAPERALAVEDDDAPPVEEETPEEVAGEPEATESPPETEAPPASRVPSPEELANEQLLGDLMARADRQRAQGHGGGGAGRVGPGSSGSGGECDDPILGTWRVRRYDGRWRQHVLFTLRITDREGERIRGRIINRSWTGGLSQQTPPRCRPGVSDHTVTMPARGRFDGHNFRLDAERHSMVQHCIDYGFGIGYNNDHFRGVIDGEQLRVVNNDGGREIDTPYVFRRISCTD